MQSFSSQLPVCYAFQEDRGFRVASARNVGIAKARADVTVMIDSGILLATTCLEAHLARHASSSGPLALIGYVYGFGPDGERTQSLDALIDPEDTDASVQRLVQSGAFDMRESRYREHGADLRRWPAPFDIFWTCHVSVQRQPFQAAGGFNEAYNSWGGEDVDLAVRLFIGGNEFALARECVAVHCPHELRSWDRDPIIVAREQEIHERYGLYETGFYRLSRERGIDLNAAINTYGDPSRFTPVPRVRR